MRNRSTISFYAVRGFISLGMCGVVGGSVVEGGVVVSGVVG